MKDRMTFVGKAAQEMFEALTGGKPPLSQAPGSDSRPRDARQMRVIETLMDGAKAAHDSGDLELHTEYCIAIGDLLVLWENTNPNTELTDRRGAGSLQQIVGASGPNREKSQ